jgi:hypothetical protein
MGGIDIYDGNIPNLLACSTDINRHVQKTSYE